MNLIDFLMTVVGSASKKTILILGGSGFVGEALTRELGSIDGVVPIAPTFRIVATWTHFELHQALKSIPRPECVINLIGGGLGRTAISLKQLEFVNSELPLRFLSAMDHLGWSNTRFFQVSSMLEAVPGGFETDYVRTKASATQKLLRLRESTGKDISIIWLSNVYGPGQPTGRFVSDIFDSAENKLQFVLRYPSRKRSFAVIGDVVRELSLIVQMTPSLTTNDYSILGCEPTSLKAACQVANQVLQQRTEPMTFKWVEEPQQDPFADPPEIRNLFGSKPIQITCQTDLEQGLRIQLESR